MERLTQEQENELINMFPKLNKRRYDGYEIIKESYILAKEMCYTYYKSFPLNHGFNSRFFNRVKDIEGKWGIMRIKNRLIKEQWDGRRD